MVIAQKLLVNQGVMMKAPTVLISVRKGGDYGRHNGTSSPSSRICHFCMF